VAGRLIEADGMWAPPSIPDDSWQGISSKSASKEGAEFAIPIEAEGMYCGARLFGFGMAVYHEWTTESGKGAYGFPKPENENLWLDPNAWRETCLQK
jgi:hypothetical protein